VLKKWHVLFMTFAVVVGLVAGLVLTYVIQANGGVMTTKITLIIETTSDWTRIAFNGLSIQGVYTYVFTHGEEYIHSSHPTTITYSWIDIIKKWPFDNNYVRIEYPLKVLISNETIRMDITKGDVGYTTVSIFNRRGNLVGTYTNTESGQDFVGWTYQAGITGGSAQNLVTFILTAEELR